MTDPERSAERSGPLFSAVVRERTLSDKVADLLLDSIVSRRLRPGDRLPSERELGDQFGVSRTVVREALRSLAAKGVIEVRSGSGLRVAAVKATAVSEFMNLFLRGRGPLDYEKVHEVRVAIEVAVARSASERATAEDVDELRRAHHHMEAVADDVETASVADLEFHRTVAKITHNELYSVMLDSIGDVLLDVRRATIGIPGRPGKASRYHQEILDRIAARDPDGAERAMRAHLDESVSIWRSLAEHAGEVEQA